MMDNGTDTHFYNSHADFELKALKMVRREIMYGESGIPFVELVVSITLARRSSFFYYMYLLPANVLLFAIPLVHFLPSNSPTKFIVCKYNIYSQFILVYHLLPTILYEQIPTQVQRLI